MEQVECRLSELPQVFTAVKSPLVICAAISVKGRSPELVRVICCTALAVVICCAAKVSVSGERASVAGDVPIPESEAVCVPAPSVIEKTPLRVPDAVGINAMETVQPTLGPRLAPQVLVVSLKSPVMEGVCRATVLAPVFEIVMFCNALVALITVDGKVRTTGVRTMAAAALALPVRVAVAL